MLVFTSLGFLIPTLTALKHRRLSLALQYGILTITSIFFHGTHHPIAKAIDIKYAYSLGAKYFLEGILNIYRYRRKKDIYLHLGTISSLYIFFYKSSDKTLPQHIQQRYHSLFHISIQYLFTQHALDNIALSNNEAALDPTPHPNIIPGVGRQIISYPLLI